MIHTTKNSRLSQGTQASLKQRISTGIQFQARKVPEESTQHQNLSLSKKKETAHGLLRGAMMLAALFPMMGGGASSAIAENSPPAAQSQTQSQPDQPFPLNLKQVDLGLDIIGETQKFIQELEKKDLEKAKAKVKELEEKLSPKKSLPMNLKPIAPKNGLPPVQLPLKVHVELNPATEMDRYFRINGEKGLYEPSSPFGYGRNAAINYFRVESESGQHWTAFMSTLRYSPKDATPRERRTGAINYEAEYQLQVNFKNKPAAPKMSPPVPLRKNEFRWNPVHNPWSYQHLLRYFQGNERLAKAYLNVLDGTLWYSKPSNDNRISSSERALFLQFQDNATELLLKKSSELNRLKNRTGIPREAFTEAKKILQAQKTLRLEYPSEPNGEITPVERMVAYQALLECPHVTRLAMIDLEKSLTQSHAIE